MADTSYLRIFEHARRELWRTNPHLTESQKQAIWADTVATGTGNTNPLTWSDNTTRMDQVPRSMSSMPSSTSFNPAAMAQFSDSTFSAMDRTASAPATVAMDRNLSTSTVPDVWSLDNQTSEYTHYSLASCSQPRSSLHSIDEVPAFGADDIAEYTPAQYIDTLPSHTFPSTSHSARLQVAPLTTDSQWSPSYDDSLSPNSSTPLLTPDTISNSSMSREGSFNPRMFDQVSMLRVHSDSSNVMPIPSGDMSHFSLFDSNISECVDSSHFLSFTGSPGESFSSPAYPSSVSTLGSYQQQLDLAEDMRRSASTSSDSDTSHASVSSAPSRQLRREREINLSASRRIAPKAIEQGDETNSASSNVQMKRVVSQDGSSKDFAAITKAPYTRPQHPKLFCDFCTDRQEGFRGTHELERHVARKHAPVRKAYICVDASPDKKFLSKCKHCRNTKEYGAYYNAAAHLRRTHFHAREKGRKAKGGEKRGGIGGGDDPPMDYLKQHWIKEIEVRGDLNSPHRRASSAGLSDGTVDNSVTVDFADYEDVDASYMAPPPMDMSAIDNLDSTAFIDQNHIEQNQFLHPNAAIFDAYGADLANFQFDAYRQP